jgi:arylsulfatase
LALVAFGVMAQEVLPHPEKAPQLIVGRTPADMPQPQWPEEPKPPKGAPNVLLIMTDDVGFGASSTFGGPIPTPTLDALAKAGLRYNEFHTTAMCSPTRAALMTGRNQHDVGTGRVTESVNAYDGYTSVMPKSAATIAEILKDNGYATALFGKWHNTPDWEASHDGPFDRWPTGMGFQHFYGFLGGGTNQYSPGLFEGTDPIEAPRNDPTYHLERDLADHAATWIHEHSSIAPSQPFFIYYAPGATHAPHQAPKEWIDKFKGKFDQGWDKVREETWTRQKALGVIPPNTQLTARPDWLPAWDSLSPDRRKVYARLMEAYAGFLAYSDYQVGRVIDVLRETGQLDNTLVIFIEGDNGASAEGGPNGHLNEGTFMNGSDEDLAQQERRIDDIGTAKAYNIYPVGWAYAMDTPFKGFKQVASHFGGTRNGMVMAWPARIKSPGGLRSQFHHVIDIAPTILDVAGIPQPTVVNGVPQKPMAGVSMAYTFDSATAPSMRSTQYFEMFGNRAIYHDGWVAAAGPVEMPWSSAPLHQSIDDIQWELYHIADDYSEAVDLAQQQPAKLRELQDLFWIEATRNHVLPMMLGKFVAGPPRPSLAADRNTFVFYPGTIRLPYGAAPIVNGGRSFEAEADVNIPAGGGSGILFTQGGRFGGCSLYLLKGKLVYQYNLLDTVRYTVSSDTAVPPGQHRIGVDFKYDGGGIRKAGTATLLLDNKPIGSGRIEQTARFGQGYGEGFDVGLDSGTPVSDDYEVPFPFNGTLTRVTVTLK